VALLASAPARAEYPERVVKMQVGFPAGGGADIIARWYADKLAKALNGNFIVENRVGASGNLALDATAKAKPDGYTFLFASTVTTAGNASLFKEMPTIATGVGAFLTVAGGIALLKIKNAIQGRNASSELAVEPLNEAPETVENSTG